MGRRGKNDFLVHTCVTTVRVFSTDSKVKYMTQFDQCLIFQQKKKIFFASIQSLKNFSYVFFDLFVILPILSNFKYLTNISNLLQNQIV